MLWTYFVFDVQKIYIFGLDSQGNYSHYKHHGILIILHDDSFVYLGVIQSRKAYLMIYRRVSLGLYIPLPRILIKFMCQLNQMALKWTIFVNDYNTKMYIFSTHPKLHCTAYKTSPFPFPFLFGTNCLYWICFFEVPI